MADQEEGERLYGGRFEEMDRIEGCDAVILAVAHRTFAQWLEENPMT